MGRRTGGSDEPTRPTASQRRAASTASTWPRGSASSRSRRHVFRAHRCVEINTSSFAWVFRIIELRWTSCECVRSAHTVIAGPPRRRTSLATSSNVARFGSHNHLRQLPRPNVRLHGRQPARGRPQLTTLSRNETIGRHGGSLPKGKTNKGTLGITLRRWWVDTSGCWNAAFSASCSGTFVVAARDLFLCG